ncbi:hypothetical protein T4E_6360 [Trichinella pseudospiralis]|uniref:Uncharacterized protein n=1 Tax=Trichinella pseudospiralis TaxID=6337 RepID=A0A0V0Y4F6_TRIPS|nr:hypothetical protein T4E_6360 [Trichinella pseudospiralis]
MIGILIALKKNEDADETKQSGKQKILPLVIHMVLSYFDCGVGFFGFSFVFLGRDFSSKNAKVHGRGDLPFLS